MNNTSARLSNTSGAGGTHISRIRALVIRDMMVRFGRVNVGFVWTIFEPMLLTCGVLAIWSLLRDPVIHGVPLIGFVLSLYMPLTMWRHMTNPMVRVISGNRGLLYHAPIGHLDIVIARLVLEFMSTTTALVVIYLILLAIGLVAPAEHWDLLLGGWLFITWYHAAIGLLIAAATERWDTMDRFIQPAQYLAIPLSSAWFMVDWLPSEFQRLILWNPQVHCFEMFRAGYFGEGVVTHYDPLYLFVWSLGLTVAGILALVSVRDHVEG